MSEEHSSSADPLEDSKSDPLLTARSGVAVPSGGVIPDGHEGIYQPSADEMRAGFREMLGARIDMLQIEAQIADEQIDLLFSPRASER
jgi:hypothetical protein